jgi:hypothetical protein
VGERPTEVGRLPAAAAGEQRQQAKRHVVPAQCARPGWRVRRRGRLQLVNGGSRRSRAAAREGGGLACGRAAAAGYGTVGGVAGRGRGVVTRPG